MAAFGHDRKVCGKLLCPTPKSDQKMIGKRTDSEASFLGLNWEGNPPQPVNGLLHLHFGHYLKRVEVRS
ncbi:hypothetical protein GOBAR_AA26889 [Gossypium barbadense]|uniref:Uncharacterized protein n=1 Tax=Gossypium barbadense TaxID=3634 RepID=A0A2P5WRT3_GOSBA|nr:hypothetical protein GOBAR_AA26889 [Gossypium barbadense]